MSNRRTSTGKSNSLQFNRARDLGGDLDRAEVQQRMVDSNRMLMCRLSFAAFPVVVFILFEVKQSKLDEFRVRFFNHVMKESRTQQGLLRFMNFELVVLHDEPEVQSTSDECTANNVIVEENDTDAKFSSTQSRSKPNERKLSEQEEVLVSKNDHAESEEDSSKASNPSKLEKTEVEKHSKNAIEGLESSQIEDVLYMHNFMCFGEYINLASFEEAMSTPESARITEYMMRDEVIKSFWQMSMWHRVSDVRNETVNLCRSAVVAPINGNTFMRRINVLQNLAQRELVLSGLCHLSKVASSICREKYFNDDDSDEGHSSVEGENDQQQKQQQMKLNADPEIQNSASEQGCTSAHDCPMYDILISNDMDRDLEIIEWASWTSYEAYLHFRCHPYVCEWDGLMNLLCIARQESVWEPSCSFRGEHSSSGLEVPPEE